MRKLWLVLAVMVVAVSAPNAHGDSFSPVFTTTGCTGTCLLPTAPDVTFPSPTTIDVTFDGVTSSVAIPSGDASGDTYAWAANKGLQPGGGSAFTLLDITTGGSSLHCFGSETSTTANGCGTLTFAAVGTAPEPSSIALMLLGVGLVFVLRKRNSRGHQLAA